MTLIQTIVGVLILIGGILLLACCVIASLRISSAKWYVCPKCFKYHSELGPETDQHRLNGRNFEGALPCSDCGRRKLEEEAGRRAWRRHELFPARRQSIQEVQPLQPPSSNQNGGRALRAHESNRINLSSQNL